MWKKIDSAFSWSKKLDKMLETNRLFIQLSLTNSKSIFSLPLVKTQLNFLNPQNSNMKKYILLLLLLPILAPNVHSQCGEGLDVTLSTQSEVDEFLATYCTDYRGHLRIINNSMDSLDNIVNLHALLGLKRVGRILVISGNSIESLAGLDSLEQVGSIRIYSNPNITDLAGLGKLAYMIGDFDISGNDALSSFNGLNSLDIIGSYLSIVGNDNLIQIDAMASVHYATGIRIFYNPVLENLNGLRSLNPAAILDNPLNIREISIYQNERLALCHNEFVCAVLLREDLEFQIENNDPGCNSTEEILQACTTTVNEAYVVPKTRAYPNPFTSELFIELYDAQWITIYDMKGRQVITINLPPGKHVLDGSDLDSGVYIIKDGLGSATKVVKI